MKIVLVLGALMYLVSWFTPVHDEGCTLSEGCIPGLEALSMALGAIDGGSDWGFLKFTSGLTNVWFLMSLVILLRWPHRLNRGIVLGLVLCTLVNAHWIVYVIVNDNNYLNDLLVGYYLWVGSFVVLAVGAGLTLKSRSRQPWAESL